jgi:hypothetical protein
MACGACIKCGKKTKAQGAMCYCMNEACPNYLVGQAPSASVTNLKEARTTAKSMVQDQENPNA